MGERSPTHYYYSSLVRTILAIKIKKRKTNDFRMKQEQWKVVLFMRSGWLVSSQPSKVKKSEVKPKATSESLKFIGSKNDKRKTEIKH